MGKQIDERVVSMQFDNALFEKNIQKSLKSVDDLNKSLNNLDGAKGFDELGKAVNRVDMTPIIASAKGAEKSFSAMEIAGMTAISRLTNSLIDFGTKLGKNFWNATIGQIKSGGWKRASDIKAGEFMLEGLGFTGKRLQEISKAASNAVSGTAAGLGEAMKSAGTLAASGLTDAKKMEDTLKGIAGVSAMTGRSFENIAQIYSTVASNGKLMTMQLRQFSFAGINVAAELAKQMHTTEAAINEMVTKGQIDFETFSKAMTDAFGEHAKDANKTFTGALANMKAALSRIGEKFATPFMDNARDVFNVLRNLFNAIKDAMGPIYEDFSKLTKIGRNFVVNVFGKINDKGEFVLNDISKTLSNIVESVRNIYSVIIMVLGTIGQAFREVFPPMKDTTQQFKQLTKSLVPTENGLKTLKFAFKLIFTVIKQVTDALGVLIEVGSTALKVIFALANRLIGVFGFFDDLTGGFFEAVKNINLFEIALDVICTSIFAVGAAIVGVIDLLGKLINKLKEIIHWDDLKKLGVYILQGLVTGLAAGYNLLKYVWTNIVMYIPNTLMKLLGIASPSKVMKKIGKFIIAGLLLGMASASGGLTTLLSLVSEMIAGLTNMAAGLISLISTGLSKGLEKVLEILKKIRKVRETTKEQIDETTSENKGGVHGYDKYTAYDLERPDEEFHKKAAERFVENNETMEESQKSLTDTIAETTVNIVDYLGEIIANIGKTEIILAGFAIFMATFLKGKIDVGTSMIGKLAIIVAGVASAIYLFQKLNLSETLSKVGDGISNFIDRILSVTKLDKKVDQATSSMEKIKEMFKELPLVAIAGKALAFSFGIATVGLILQITKVIKFLGQSVKTIATILKNFSGLDFNFGFKETLMDKLIKISLSFTTIVIAITSMAKISDPTALDKAVKIAIGIATVLAVLVGVMIFADQMAKFGDSSKTISAVNRSMMSFAALLTVMFVLSSIISKNSGAPWIIITQLGLITLMFAATIKCIETVQKGGKNISITASISTLLGIAAIVATLGATINSMLLIFKGYKDAWSIGTAVIGVATMLGVVFHMLGVVLEQMKDTTEYLSGGWKESKMAVNISAIAAISGFLLAVGAFFKVLSTIPLEGAAGVAVGTISALISMAAIAAVLNKYKDKLTNLGDEFEKVAGDMLKLTAAMYLLSKLPLDAYQEALSHIIAIYTTIMSINFAFSVLTTVVNAAFAFFHKLNENIPDKAQTVKMTDGLWAIGTALLSIAVGIAALGLIFGLMPEDRLKAFIVWTSILTALIVVLVGVLSGISAKWSNDKDSDIKSKVMGIIGAISLIAAMMVSLVILSIIPFTDILGGLIAMGAIVAGIYWVLKAISMNNKYVEKLKGPLIVLAVIVGELSILMGLLAFLPKDKMGNALLGAAGIAMVMFSLAAVFNVFRSTRLAKIDASVIGAMVLIAAFIAEVALIMYALSSMPNPDTCLNSAIAIGGLMLALAGTMFIISQIKSIDPTVIAGLAISLLTIVAIIGSFYALQNIDSSKLLAIAGSISIITATMGLFIAALGLISSVFPVVTPLVLAFGAAFIKMGAGVLLAGAGISAVILSLGYSIGLIADAIERLQTMDIDKVASGILKLAGAVIALGGAVAGSVVLIAGSIALLGVALIGIAGKLLPIFIGIGGFIMGGLAQGIDKGEKGVLSTMMSGLKTLLKSVLSFFGIASPSKVFRGIGEFLMKGLDLGIIQGLPIVGDTLKNGITDMINWLNGKADEFEKVGDTWGNAIGVIAGDAINDKVGGMFDIFGNKDEDSLGSFLDQYIGNTDDAADGSDLLGDALDSMGLSADGAAGSMEGLNTSMSSTIDMFEQFNDTAYMTSRDVLPAFMSQLEGVSKWQSELESLASRGLGEVIIQELAAMGPQAYEKVHAIYQMTNAELAMMNIMYKQKLSLQNKTERGIKNSFKKLPGDITDTLEDGFAETGDALVDQMDDLGSRMMKALKKQIDYQKVIDQVTGFRDNVADKIRSSMSIFEAVNEQEKESVEDLLSNMKAQVKHVGRWASMITELAAKGYDEGLVAMLTDMGPESYSKVEAFLSANEEQIAEANRLYRASEEVPNYGADKIVKAFAQAGYNASMGLTDSFLEGLDPEAVEQAMWDLGQHSITNLLESLSTPFSAGKLGEMYAGSFADGLEAQVDKVKGAAEKVADAANVSNYLDDPNLPKEIREGQLKTFGSKEYQELRKSEGYWEDIMKQRDAADEQKKRTDLYYLNTYGIDKNAKKEIEKERTLSKQIMESYNYADVVYSDNLLDQALDKAMEYYVKTNRGLDRYNEEIGKYIETISTGYGTESGGIISGTNYYIDAMHDSLWMALRDMSSSGDEDAKYLLDYFNKLYANTEDGMYQIGYNGTEAIANASVDRKALNKVVESGDKVANTMIGSVAGYGGAPSNLPMTAFNHADALKDTPLAKGFGMLSDAAVANMAETAESRGEELIPEAIGHLHDLTLESLAEALTDILDRLMGEDEDVTLGIHPVIDFLEDPVSSIKDMFRRNPIDLTASTKIDTTRKDARNSQADMVSRMNTMIESQSNTNNLLNQIYNKDSNVYMDSNRLVGVIGPVTDRYLGRQSQLAGRGLA